MGKCKSTISMAIFNGFLYVYQRVMGCLAPFPTGAGVRNHHIRNPKCYHNISPDASKI